MAPVAMFSAWVLALAGQMIWPVPTFDPFAPMTTRDFLVIAPLCLPAMLYLALLSWLFAKAAGPHAPSVRLRAKNFSLSVGIFAYLLMVVNVVIGYGVQALAPDGARQAITRLQFALEDQLAIVIVLSIPLGLALGTAPAAGDFLFRTAYPAFLKLRDGFEARRWQLASAGKLRRLTRALYHAEGAADFLAMSNGDRAKTIAAVELTAILADPPADAPEITPEKSRRLLTLQRNLLDEETLAKLFSFSSTFNENTVEDRDISADDPFPDALEAALALTQNGREAKGAPERFGQFPWFHLAAVVAENAGIIQAPKTWVSNTESGALTRRRVVRAYFAAQQAATARSG